MGSRVLRTNHKKVGFVRKQKILCILQAKLFKDLLILLLERIGSGIFIIAK
jgi:hypothetical protein